MSVPLVLALGVVALALGAAHGPASLQRTVVVAVINIVLVVGLYVFVGNSGVYSFGHLGFAAIGAYTAGLLVMPVVRKAQLLADAPALVRTLTAAPPVAVLVGGVLAAAVAVVLAVPLSRIDGLTAGLATVSLLISVSVVAASWDSVTRGRKGLSAIPSSTTLPTALAWASVAIVAAWCYQRSPFGKRLRASKDDPVAAASAGISVPLQRGIAFVISAFFTGVGGALFALFLGSVTPDVFYLNYTFLVLTMLVIGGADSLTGAVLGAVVVSVLSETLRRAEAGDVLGLVQITPRPGMQNVILGLLLVAMLLRRPSGITGGREIRLPRRPGRRPARATSRPTEVTSGGEAIGETTP
ncbi:branched-chain amino acid ABC transporter permease [Pseudonocardia acidicola]|uniref:Branched-chain amino acid ABC transporter permease n=1 Tax=Pseudonocardia acidicola TaxID=2724939 RepID=A0ABX1SJU8_9PSEU|nr:branched-chain amino acid ABC transporter permease [Pseudonocardia acidicola]NMI01842.1 branched-chain amino acid ABC transporter permease [Pseudonocardia acidicola]